MSWNCNEEKLLCHIVLDDRFAKYISSRAGPAFFRAFIVQDRQTGIVSMKFRFKYISDDRHWFEVKPEDQGTHVTEELRTGMLEIMNEATAELFGRPLPPGAVECFYPPDDEGDCMRTIEWLKEKDLIEVTEVKTVPRSSPH